MDKNELQALWEQATELPDTESSPLARAIIAEAFMGDDICEGPKCDPREAAERVYRLAEDCESFGNAITERAQGLTR